MTLAVNANPYALTIRNTNGDRNAYEICRYDMSITKYGHRNTQ